MSAQALGIVHGLVLGLTTLLGVGWCLMHFWQAHINWPIVTPACGGAFRKRVTLLALLTWATALSGWALAGRSDAPWDLWLLWKASSGLVSALSLSLTALSAWRVGDQGFGRRTWRVRWLSGLILAQGGGLLAALLGALSHYLR